MFLVIEVVEIDFIIIIIFNRKNSTFFFLRFCIRLVCLQVFLFAMKVLYFPLAVGAICLLDAMVLHVLFY